MAQRCSFTDFSRNGRSTVLYIPTNTEQPIRILYLLFGGFILDNKFYDETFGVDDPATYQMLLICCPQLLSGPESLRENMYSIGYPGRPRQDVSSSLLLASAPKDRTARLWKSTSGQEIKRLEDIPVMQTITPTHDNMIWSTNRGILDMNEGSLSVQVPYLGTNFSIILIVRIWRLASAALRQDLESRLHVSHAHIFCWEPFVHRSSPSRFSSVMTSMIRSGPILTLIHDWIRRGTCKLLWLP